MACSAGFFTCLYYSACRLNVPLCMLFDPHALKIYVDGSALENPGGPGGLAGIVEFPEDLNRENEVIFEDGNRRDPGVASK